jgi:hypothetical protein
MDGENFEGPMSEGVVMFLKDMQAEAKRLVAACEATVLKRNNKDFEDQKMHGAS